MPNLFPILIEVEEVAVGRVLRKLDGMEGVAHIRLKLRDEKRQTLIGSEVEEAQVITAPPMLTDKTSQIDGRSMKHLKAVERPPYQAIAAILQHTPAHNTMLVKAIERVGINKKRVPAYVARMSKWGWIRRTAPGTYALTSKGNKAFFGSTSKQATAKKKLLPLGFIKPVDNRSGFRHFVLTALKKERDNDPDQIGLISRSDLTRIVTDAKMSGANLWSTGGKMVQEGLINFENGFFSITEEGLKVLQPLSNVTDEIELQSNEEGLAANG